jgi:hypothetical protein
MLLNKIRLAIGGKKSIATSVVLIIGTAATMLGFEVPEEIQKELVIIIGSLIAIFLRLGTMKAEAAAKEAKAAAEKAAKEAKKKK